MSRIVVAFESESGLGRICEMLESSGISIRYRCRSGGEVIRAVTTMGGGIVVCGYKLTDMPSSELINYLEDAAFVLMIAKPVQLELCENKGVFKLPTPVFRSELFASIGRLLQMEEKRLREMLPRRSAEEEELFERAKALLMEKNNMAEEQAHRLIQRRSMNSGIKVAETARLIIESLS